MREKLGICQWFHYQDYAGVEMAVALLRELGIRHLRTGISWADYLRPQGKDWYDWQMAALSEFEVLLSVWHTPPSLSERGTCASPPLRLQDYADFIDLMITQYGDRFTHLELWNEPNNRYKWDFPQCDPAWEKFGMMVGMAAYWARTRGKPTVLGGMIPVDPQWLALIVKYGVLAEIDVVAIHGFPEMWHDGCNWEWYEHWDGWETKLSRIQAQVSGRPIWITETGLSTWETGHQTTSRLDLQCHLLEAAAAAPTERVYWYSLIDLDPDRDAIEGFHVDEHEYHMGLVQADGHQKPAFEHFRRLLQQN